MSYNAIIGRIKVSPHPDPNVNKIQLGIIYNEQVIVDKNTLDNILMIFFPCDGQLSEVFAKANDLISYTDPETGKKAGGYFATNCRVRAQKFRGQISDGFACPLSYLVKAGIDMQTVESLKEGDQFCILNDIEICRKYITPATKNAGGHNQQKKAIKKNPRFHEHIDTKQLRYEINNIPKYAILYLTFKLHGSSARYAYVQEEITKPLKWYQKPFKKYIKKQTELVYKYQAGTRRVNLNIATIIDPYYGSSEFRLDFMKDVFHKMRKGETIYGEIVGYDNNNKPIMPTVSTTLVKDKMFAKLYGKEMTFKYGCPIGTHKFYVYRITTVNEDGYAIDLSWPIVKNRCIQLGLEHVPEAIPYPIVFNKDIDQKTLMAIIQSSYLEHASVLDSSHIEEGIVVRVEYYNGVYFLKEKSFIFKILEGIIKDNSDYVDMEEVEDNKKEE